MFHSIVRIRVYRYNIYGQLFPRSFFFRSFLCTFRVSSPSITTLEQYPPLDSRWPLCTFQIFPCILHWVLIALSSLWWANITPCKALTLSTNKHTVFSSIVDEYKIIFSMQQSLQLHRAHLTCLHRLDLKACLLPLRSPVVITEKDY